MLSIGQTALGLAQLARMLLSMNVVVGVALLGAVVHTVPAHLVNGPHVDSQRLVFNSTYSVLTDSYENSEDERKQYVRQIIPPAFYKFHFIFTLGMFLFIAFAVMSESKTMRALLLLPIVLSYGIAHILYAADQAEMVNGMMKNYKRRVTKRIGE